MDQLESRLAKLERENRATRALLLGVLLLLCAVGWIGAADPAPDVIRARQFDLVDEQGRVTARLESDYSGGILRLLTIGGTDVTRLSTTPSGGLVELSTPSGKVLFTARAGFLAGMLRVDAAMLKVDSVDYGSTVIMADSVRSVDHERAPE